MRLQAALDSRPRSGDSAGLSVHEFDGVDNPGVQRPTYPDKTSTGATQSSKVYRISCASIFLDIEAPACRRLISHAPPHEVISLIETIFTSREEVKTIGYLRGDDAQTFIDVTHEVRPHPPWFPTCGLITFVRFSFAFGLSPLIN